MKYEIFELTSIIICEIASKVSHLYYDSHLEEYLKLNLVMDFELKRKIEENLREIEQIAMDENIEYDIITVDNFLPDFFTTLLNLLKLLIRNASLIQKFLRYNNFCINEFGLNEQETDKAIISKEFGEIEYFLYSNMNSLILKILTVDNVEHSFLDEVGVLLT
jgi:hypothetical protein